MVLDPTVRESNLKDSIKRFLHSNKANLSASGPVPLLFDKSLAEPAVQRGPETADKWIAVAFGRVDFGTVSRAVLYLNVCTRKDPEGYKLSQLRDRLLGLFFDPDYSNGKVPIPLYQSNTDPWTIVGYMLPVVSYETGGRFERDETKFKSITLELRWGARG